jgi:hypothetical protein
MAAEVERPGGLHNCGCVRMVRQCCQLLIRCSQILEHVTSFFRHRGPYATVQQELTHISCTLQGLNRTCAGLPGSGDQQPAGQPRAHILRGQPECWMEQCCRGPLSAI